MGRRITSWEESYRVPLETARVVNQARRAGRRVVAVGATAMRALETVAHREGTLHPGEGWTALVVTPERGLRVVDSLLTGLHEAHASRLLRPVDRKQLNEFIRPANSSAFVHLQHQQVFVFGHQVLCQCSRLSCRPLLTR